VLLAGAPLAGGAESLPVDAPVLAPETPRGSGTRTVVARHASVAVRSVDGQIADWIGRPARLGGALRASHGELIYQDHLFDAFGPDDGRDAERLAVLDPLEEAVPETYRLDPLQQADIPGQVGLPSVAALAAPTHYGDLPRQDASDLQELRVSFDADSLWVLARTTTMTAAEGTALLLLVDSRPGSASHPVPFGSELTSTRADLALVLAGDRGWVANLITGAIEPLPAGSVATNPDGYVNAIEGRVPRAALTPDSEGVPAEISLAAATGAWDGARSAFASSALNTAIANVAFRTEEPVREWFDKRQALALHAGSIDTFFTRVEVDALAAGLSESFVPGPGYHERVFQSAEEVSQERGEEGVFQHYGLYLPKAYRDGTASPMQLWLHWRGGKAHSAGALTPRVFKHLGEDRDAVVVAPRGRGTSRWYVGKGHVDFLEVWRDAMRTVSVDRDRVYVSGHSMGGYGSYLLSVLYPDRFAAAMPAQAPVTQGAWTGVDFDGCDELKYEDYTPCYVEANGSDPRAQHTRRLLENVRNLPLAILQGSNDELVPTTGVTRQVERLVQLGYRHRYYVFLPYEHYSVPIVDQWASGARYMHGFRRPADPPQVTYIRDMPFERAVETVQSDGLDLDFDFNSAYWMSELEPADGQTGVARFDGRSLAMTPQPKLTVPEAGGPAELDQIGPYVMTGLKWLANPTAARPAAQNAFEATLAGAQAVRLALGRMKIDTTRQVRGTVTTDRPLQLRLKGAWTTPPSVEVGGAPVSAALADRVLVLDLPAGTSQLVIG
jgi:pimeloyl-ACP methyl ester carboxylesterase